MSHPKLTEAQRRVMKWLGKGWSSEPGAGCAVMVNGKRICNIDTMTVLHKLGLVEPKAHGCWSATEAGRRLTEELGL